MRKPSVLIVGGTGYIGNSLAKKLTAFGSQTTVSSRSPTHRNSAVIDLRLAPETWILPTQNFDAIVLLAGVTSIQACEANPELTWQINVEAVTQLAERLANSTNQMIYISSNLATTQWLCSASAGHEVRQLNAHTQSSQAGLQKAAVEKMLGAIPNSWILRTTKVIGPSFSLFDNWITDLRADRQVTPYFNKYFAPVSLARLIEIVHFGILNRIYGLDQISAKAGISYAQAAEILATRLNLPLSLVQPKEYTERLVGDHVEANVSMQVSARLLTFATSALRVIEGYADARINQT